MYFVTNMLACAPVPPLAGLTCDRPTAYSAWVGQSAGLAERCWYIQLASRMPGRLITAETPPRKGCCPNAGRRGPADPGPVPAHSAGTGRPSGREGRCWTCTRWRPKRPTGTNSGTVGKPPCDLNLNSDAGRHWRG